MSEKVYLILKAFKDVAIAIPLYIHTIRFTNEEQQSYESALEDIFLSLDFIVLHIPALITSYCTYMCGSVSGDESSSVQHFFNAFVLAKRNVRDDPQM